MNTPDDVLWHIFSQNVPSPPFLDPENQSSWHRDWPHCQYHKRMQTAKSTSQVCRQWRRVMLSSTDIWSKVIEFDTISSFCKPNSCLRTVVARAGPTRKFYVTGRVATHRALRAFLELVSAVWDRIEVVNVELDPDRTAEALVGHAGWAKLTDEVSTSLRYFNLVEGFSLYDGDDQPRPFQINSRSPNLVALRFEGMLQFVYEPRPPQFDALRVLSFHNTLQDYHSSLVMDGTRYEWTVDVLFGLLESTPRLEVFYILDNFLLTLDPSDYKDRPRLGLLHLRELDVNCDISACLAILYHLEISQTCALSMGADIVDYDIWPEHEVNAIQEVLWSRYVKERAFGHFVSLSFADFCPSLTWRSSSESNFDQLYLHFNTSSHSGRRSSTFFPFLELLLGNAFDFSNVVYLKMDLQRIGPVDRSIIQPLMNKFKKVRSLKLDWKEVSFLISDTICGYPEILPELEEVELLDRIDPIEDVDTGPWLRNLITFCGLYTRRGSAPIESSVKLSGLKHLDMYDMHYEEEINHILPLLDELEGLTVSFGDGRYPKVRKSEVCGFGRFLDMKVKGGEGSRKWDPNAFLTSDSD